MLPVESRRTQEERRTETRRLVVDAAIQLIGQRGSRSVTLAEVGEAAGHSRGIVYHHFGSRERLLEAVLDETQRFEVPSYEGNGLDHLVRLVAAYLKNVGGRTSSARAFLQLWGEAIAREPTLAPLFATRDEDFRRLLADIVRSGVADESICDKVEPDSAAVMLLALVRGIGLQLIASPPVERLPALVLEASRLVHSAFAASPTDSPDSTDD